MIINSSDYSAFIVCGLEYNSAKRFRKEYAPEQIHFAFGINLWRGNVYGVRKDTGKRQKLKSVWN